MKHRLINAFIILALLFTWQGIHTKTVLATPLCNGTSCENLNPNTMGCTGDTYGSVKILTDGKSTTETRGSANNDCDAKWGRTINKSGGNRYAAASLRYGCVNYCYNKSIASPAMIASGEQVYTMMHAYAFTPTRTCGSASSSGPIGIPLSISDSGCTGAN